MSTPVPAPSARLAPSPAPERAPVAAGGLMEILAPHRETFLAFLRRRRVSPAAAEDMLQQSLLRVAERAATLRDPNAALPWFYRILRRALAEQSDARAPRAARYEVLTADPGEAAPEEPPPDEAASCACALGLLDSIRPEYAAILRRVDLDDEPLASAAAALHITPNNAGVRLHRARKALREALQERCGVDSLRACLDCGCDE
ncbi:DNA-directed RNA polymerase specialized sigma subunit, sigma24-like protein [Minicystis rosea]|nr:DNA-directed RNA polymerase specialized sigma subunit, sigma24-like protein [Minicystis rosea]